MVQKPSTFLVGAFWTVVLGIEVMSRIVQYLSTSSLNGFFNKFSLHVELCLKITEKT